MLQNKFILPEPKVVKDTANEPVAISRRSQSGERNSANSFDKALENSKEFQSRQEQRQQYIRTQQQNVEDKQQQQRLSAERGQEQRLEAKHAEQKSAEHRRNDEQNQSRESNNEPEQRKVENRQGDTRSKSETEITAGEEPDSGKNVPLDDSKASLQDKKADAADTSAELMTLSQPTTKSFNNDVSLEAKYELTEVDEFVTAVKSTEQADKATLEVNALNKDIEFNLEKSHLELINNGAIKNQSVETNNLEIKEALPDDIQVDESVALDAKDQAATSWLDTVLSIVSTQSSSDENKLNFDAEKVDFNAQQELPEVPLKGNGLETTSLFPELSALFATKADEVALDTESNLEQVPTEIKLTGQEQALSQLQKNQTKLAANEEQFQPEEELAKSTLAQQIEQIVNPNAAGLNQAISSASKSAEMTDASTLKPANTMSQSQNQASFASLANQNNFASEQIKVQGNELSQQSDESQKAEFDKQLMNQFRTNSSLSQTLATNTGTENTNTPGQVELMGVQLDKTLVHAKLDNVAQAKQETMIKEAILFNKQELANNMQQQVGLMMAKNMKSVDIRLDPPELGTIQVKLNLNNEQAAVSFVVSTQQAKDALENSMSRLRELLEQQGMELAEGEVKKDNSRGEAGDSESDQQGGNQLGKNADGSADEEGLLDVEQTVQHSVNSPWSVDYYA